MMNAANDNEKAAELTTYSIQWLRYTMYESMGISRTNGLICSDLIGLGFGPDSVEIRVGLGDGVARGLEDHVVRRRPPAGWCG